MLHTTKTPMVVLVMMMSTPIAKSMVTIRLLRSYIIDNILILSSIGKFLPTLRTPGISTSDLLARLVSGYRHRIWDKKLEKMGMRDLMAEGSDWDESRVGSRRGSRGGSREPSPPRSPGSNGSEKGEKVL